MKTQTFLRDCIKAQRVQMLVHLSDLLVMFSEPQQQLVVETLEVLPQQRAQFNLCLTLSESGQNDNKQGIKSQVFI